MEGFREYITEAAGKNTHLEHLEDEVFNGGMAGTRKALDFLRGLKQMLAGHSASKVNVTVKWDGAPAIFCGINPENGKFFVGTKSVFNAKEPKINYTEKDIDRNHGAIPELANKLKIALKELPKLDIRGVVQGDFLYARSDLKEVEIDGEKLIAFRPNTITYTVPADSHMAQMITQSKIGIVFHTSYSGHSILSMKASFGVDSSKFTKSSSVWATDATFRDESGTTTLTKDETATVSAMLAELTRLVKQMDPKIIDGIVKDSQLQMLIKTYVNSQIKVGVGIEGTKKYATGLVDFIASRFEADAAKLKTEKGKEGKLASLGRLRDLLRTHREQLVLMFRVSELISEVKGIVIGKLQKAKSLGTFLETPNGYKVTAPEGFVAIDRMGSAVKLVDRLEFSKANFTLDKTWAK